MSIGRFFGKGRGGQPKPRGKDEPMPRRPPSTAATADAESPPPRTAATNHASPPPRPGEAATSKTATTTRIDVLPGLSTTQPPTYEEIAARAYDLWLSHGQPQGCERENWIEAERQLRKERSGG